MVGVASAHAPHYESKPAMQNSRGSRIPVFDSQSPAAYSRSSKHNPKEDNPSRLTRMKADYQEKMLKEKEAKMSRMYEEQQNSAMERVGGKGMLREFFKERRQSSDKLPIQTHYQERRAQYSGPSSAASSRVSSRGSSIPSAQSSAKGIDRSFPLEPIQHKPGRPPRGPGRPPPPGRGRGRGEPENGHVNGPPPPPKGRGRGRGRPPPAGDNLPEDPNEREMQELMKRIEKEKAELNRMRKEEEQEQEMERKRAADQRRKQNEARKREAEAERRKQEAIKQRKQAEDTEARQRRREQQQLDFEEEQRRYREEMESANQPAPKPTRRPAGRGPPPEDEPPRRAPPPRGPPRRTEPSPSRPPPQRQQRPPPNRSRETSSPPLPPAGTRAKREASTAFYVQAIAESEDAIGGSMKLRPCPKCGRKFAEDRIRKHVDACTEGKRSKRKVFDTTKMRTQGTEAESYARKNKNKSIEQIVGKEGLKNNWRAKHDEFQQMIKYNRKLKAAEQQGAEAVAALAPPPPSNTSDYKQCPHCGRRFSPGAADRHIPKCAQIKSNKRR